jgi:hypothetical protein
MHVIDHQNVCMQLAVVARERIPQVGEIALVVRRVDETWIIVVAALRYVLRYSRQIEARLPCHVLLPPCFSFFVRVAACTFRPTGSASSAAWERVRADDAIGSPAHTKAQTCDHKKLDIETLL